jgi:N6-L-threonylcarbamoyladenine synthase
MMKDKCQAKGILLDYPQPKLCTDNGAMIASAGYYKYVKGDFAPENLTAMPNLKIGG